MENNKNFPNNENGSVIVAALMILALLTIIGFSAINNSTTEQHLATNTLLYERAFYATEAGFEHAKAILRVPYIEQNQGNIALGNPGSWSFALDDTVFPRPVPGDCTFDKGVVLLQSELDGITYTVKIWNNRDGALGACTPESDNDGSIMIRASVEGGPRGATCAIESLIEGTTDSGNLDGYKAQAGAGAGKSYSNNDLESIDFNDIDFGQQM